MKKEAKKTDGEKVIAYRRACKASEGTGLAHYVMTKAKSK